MEKISATGTQITEKDIDTIFANQEAVIIQYFDEKIDNANLAIQELMGRQEQITKEMDKTEAQVQEMLAITTNQQRDAFEAAYDAQIDQYRMAYVNDAMQMENLESMVKGYDFGQAIKGLTETAEKVSNVNENEGKPNWLQQFGNSAAQTIDILTPEKAGGLAKGPAFAHRSHRISWRNVQRYRRPRIGQRDEKSPLGTDNNQPRGLRKNAPRGTHTKRPVCGGLGKGDHSMSSASASKALSTSCLRPQAWAP